MKLRHEQHCDATLIEFELNLSLIEKYLTFGLKIELNSNLIIKMRYKLVKILFKSYEYGVEKRTYK
jgi:hypothetical protein